MITNLYVFVFDEVDHGIDCFVMQGREVTKKLCYKTRCQFFLTGRALGGLDDVFVCLSMLQNRWLILNIVQKRVSTVLIKGGVFISGGHFCT